MKWYSFDKELTGHTPLTPILASVGNLKWAAALVATSETYHWFNSGLVMVAHGGLRSWGPPIPMTVRGLAGRCQRCEVSRLSGLIPSVVSDSVGEGDHSSKVDERRLGMF